jgi:hypothetical protein
MDQTKFPRYSSSSSTTAALCVAVSPGQICSLPHSKGCSWLPNCSAPFYPVDGPTAAANSSDASVGTFTFPFPSTEYSPSRSTSWSPLLHPSLSGPFGPSFWDFWPPFPGSAPSVPPPAPERLPAGPSAGCPAFLLDELAKHPCDGSKLPPAHPYTLSSS